MSIAAPATDPGGNLELKLPATIGTAGQFLTVDGSGNLVWANPPGITQADQWLMTADDNGESDLYITSNLARPSYDQGSYGLIGSGMTQNSGVFSFPSTGIWHIHFQAQYHDNGVNAAVNAQIHATADNSTYSVISQGRTSNYRDASDFQKTTFTSALWDVTDTTNQKVKFRVTSSTNVDWQGQSARMETGMIFIRLGDT